jgi:hypothetical protein
MIRSMALPAFLQVSPEAASRASGEAITPLPPEVEQLCSTLWERARPAWATHPSEGTPVEDEALRATFALFVEAYRALVGRPKTALRAIANDGLRRVVVEEQATAEIERSFALKQLEQAIEHYALVVEALAVGADFDDEVTRALEAAEGVEEMMPAELRPLYRANGALLMAFEAMTSGPSDEFRYWARQAVERWRGIVAALPSLTAVLRGARTHLGARRAWDSWNDEDRAVERDAWKALR